MAVLFKKALVNCFRQDEESITSLKPNKASSVYDCCTFYWLPIDDRLWSGELDFKFIQQWSEDVELYFTGDNDKNNNNNNNRIEKPTTRPTSSTKISIKNIKVENWENDLFSDSQMNFKRCRSSWDEELFSDEFLNSFIFLRESWEGDFFSESFVLSFGGLSVFKESWEGELLF